MNQIAAIPWWKLLLEKAGDQALFLQRLFKNIFKTGFEWDELIRQCFMVGYKSLPLVTLTGFIIGLVITLQTDTTLKSFGAEGFVPSMISISVVREVGPVVIALICVGKIASGIGAELGSMNVTEQIDAMDVSGANPIQYLVVPRVLACTIMVPLLTITADLIALLGGFAGENLDTTISLALYFNKSFEFMVFSDIIPALIKTVFFGFAIGFIGCYQGYNARSGTEGVGRAANTSVVYSSFWIIILDAAAAQLTNVFVYH